MVEAVAALHQQHRRPVRRKEVAALLGLNVYRPIRRAINAGWIKEEGVTRARGVKRLLPVQAEHSFLPHPDAVFAACREIADTIVFDPLTAEPHVFRRT